MNMIDPRIAAQLGNPMSGGPSQDEQRRIAALQFTLASRPSGFDSAATLVAECAVVEDYIQSGPVDAKVTHINAVTGTASKRDATRVDI